MVSLAAFIVKAAVISLNARHVSSTATIMFLKTSLSNGGGSIQKYQASCVFFSYQNQHHLWESAFNSIFNNKRMQLGWLSFPPDYMYIFDFI